LISSSTPGKLQQGKTKTSIFWCQLDYNYKVILPLWSSFTNRCKYTFKCYQSWFFRRILRDNSTSDKFFNHNIYACIIKISNHIIIFIENICIHILLVFDCKLYTLIICYSYSISKNS
jgi:hypothetical protein